MKPSEAAVLLSRVAPFTRREPSEADALAWAESLDPEVTLGDALEAVASHYRATDAWIMPSHVNDRVRAIQRERVRADGVPDIPGGLDYDREQAWRRAYHAQIRQGVVRAEAEQAAHRAIGYTPSPEINRPVAGYVRQIEKRWSA